MAPDRDPALHVEVRPGRGPYVLLVHGMLSSRAQWRPNVDALAQVCRPVVVELWGHGRSPSPADAEAYTPEAYVAAFEDLRRSLGVDRWPIIGQSLGGALTLRYALDHPERVSAHVFTNSASALGDEDWQASVALSVQDLADRIDAEGADAVAALPQHPSRARRLPPDLVAELVADAALLEPAGVARTLRHTVPRSSGRARASANQVPTLLVVGVHERGFAPARAFAEAAMPLVEVVEADAGHAPNLQAPDTFNAAVARFLTEAGA